MTEINRARQAANRVGEVTYAKDFGAIGDDSTNDTVAIQAALDALVDNGVLDLGIGNTYLVYSPVADFDTDWNGVQDVPLKSTHPALHLPTGIDNITIRGVGSTLKLVSQNGATEISYILGNIETNTLTGLNLEGIIFDMDKRTVANEAAEDVRALLLVSIDDIRINNCTFYGDSGQNGGYAADLWNCNQINIGNSLVHYVSGGFAFIYCSNIVISGVTFYDFNEAIDLDKNVETVSITGCTFTNPQESGQAIDINASRGVSITGNTFNSLGTSTIDINGKKQEAAWSDHIAETGTEVWSTPGNISISGNAFTDCAKLATSTFFSIGNNWTGDTDRSTSPGYTSPSPYNVAFVGNVCKGVGGTNIQECEGFNISDNIFTDVVSPTASTGWWAIKITSESDWSSWSGNAENYSLTKGIVSNNIFSNLNGGGIRARYVNQLEISGNTFEDCALTETLEGDQTVIRLGDIAAAAATEEYPLMVASSNMTIFDVLLVVSTDVTANDTDYADFTIRNRDSVGANPATIITANTTITTGIDMFDHAPVRMNTLITDTDSDVTKLTVGQPISININQVGAGQDLDNLIVIIRHMES